jgi:membrane protease YdiL (CAAX protease family)
MLYPAIANILTRIITKEGKGEHYLKADLKKHKGICLAAAFFPLIAGIINLFAMHFLFDKSTDMAKLLDTNTEGKGASMLLAVICLTYLQDIPLLLLGFGEEFGWRAYLTPKLEKLMPRLPACCVTGIIWGLWHAPLTCIGHNFGTDYPGFPYLGILCMCLMCILFGILLTFITEKSGSVWPAAIMHAVNNAGPSILQGYVDPERSEASFSIGMISLLISLLIVVIPVMVIWYKKK